MATFGVELPRASSWLARDKEGKTFLLGRIVPVAARARFRAAGRRGRRAAVAEVDGLRGLSTMKKRTTRMEEDEEQQKSVCRVVEEVRRREERKGGKGVQVDQEAWKQERSAQRPR